MGENLGEAAGVGEGLGEAVGVGESLGEAAGVGVGDEITIARPPGTPGTATAFPSTAAPPTGVYRAFGLGRFAGAECERPGGGANDPVQHPEGAAPSRTIIAIHRTVRRTASILRRLPGAPLARFVLQSAEMRAYDVIRTKRDGGALSPAQIAFVIDGYTRGDIPDYQMSSLLMAVLLRGMDARELAAWTRAMMDSGKVLDLSAIPGAKVDKHSTGGVGDKISLPLAPLVAACGVRVPMVSGRGLGHTGGTLDKLQSIPGFRVDLSTADYQRLVREVGCCLIGQTAEIAPADKKLYALRDVTATVESVPLIASSIMSKKLAEGIDALVLDVKVGKGAFMKTKKDATILAKTMVAIGKRMGKKVAAVLTDMSQPLGRTVGNALEVKESIDVLSGTGPADIVELTAVLGGWMLYLGGAEKNPLRGSARIRAAIDDRSGLAKFREIVRAQGGDPAAIDDPSRLPRAAHRLELLAPRAGIVQAVDAEEVGVAALILGAGREKSDDVIDPAVGVEVLKKVGDPVTKGEPIARIHYNDDARLGEATARLESAWTVARTGPKRANLFLGVIR